MRKFKIDNGRVTFHVEREFDVTLTLMGDQPRAPWRILDVSILVADKEAGQGKELVHPQQVKYVLNYAQLCMERSTRALVEVFNVLHSFCQMLQLAVLQTQAENLKKDRLDGNIQIEEYEKGSRLVISYWRALAEFDPRSALGYKLIIQTDPSDQRRPLTVLHSPPIGAKDSAEIADRSVRSDTLSMERLLVHTVHIRTLERLNDLKAEFQTFLKDVDCK